MRARSTLKEAAYEEYKVTRQCSTGNGELYVAQAGVPGWFVHTELGFGIGEGPSLRYTLAMLPVENPRRLARFKRPARVNVVAALPHTVTGKMSRSRLRATVRRRNLGLLE